MRNKGKIKWIKKRERREEGKEDRIKYSMWIVEDIFLLNAYHYYLMFVTQTSSLNIWIYIHVIIYEYIHIYSYPYSGHSIFPIINNWEGKLWTTDYSDFLAS